LAVIDGLRIGGLRTALVTSLAIRRILAGSPQQLLICGSGFQAAQHLATLRAALPQAQFVVWDRTPEHAQRLAAKFDHRVTVSLNLADAVANADVVIGATSASTPYLKYDWFHSGQLYVHIGLHDMAPADVAKFQWLVCDDYRAGQLTSQQSLFVAYRQGAIAAERVRLLETLVTPLRVPGPVMFDQFGLQMFDFVLAEYALSQVEKGVSFGHGIARN
jgi:ornithine cyclodeaminase